MTALVIELIILWEKEMPTAHEHKRTKCSELTAEGREASWTIFIYPLENSEEQQKSLLGSRDRFWQWLRRVSRETSLPPRDALGLKERKHQ